MGGAGVCEASWSWRVRDQNQRTSHSGKLDTGFMLVCRKYPCSVSEGKYLSYAGCRIPHGARKLSESIEQTPKLTSRLKMLPRALGRFFIGSRERYGDQTFALISYLDISLEASPCCGILAESIMYTPKYIFIPSDPRLNFERLSSDTTSLTCLELHSCKKPKTVKSSRPEVPR